MCLWQEKEEGKFHVSMHYEDDLLIQQRPWTWGECSVKATSVVIISEVTDVICLHRSSSLFSLHKVYGLVVVHVCLKVSTGQDMFHIP